MFSDQLDAQKEEHKDAMSDYSKALANLRSQLKSLTSTVTENDKVRRYVNVGYDGRQPVSDI